MFSRSDIRAILFDLDGTLRSSRPSFLDAFLAFAARYGAPIHAEARPRLTRWQHRYWAQSEEMIADVRQHNGLTAEFWLHYAGLELEALGCSEAEAQGLAPLIQRALDEEFRPENWVPDDVRPTLRALKEAGFTLGVVSNRSLPYEEELKTLDLAEFFEFVIAAGPINTWKPEPGIFQHALAQAAALAEHSVYVGDNYYADIVGAQRAGMHAVLIDPEGIFPEAGCHVIAQIGELRQVFLTDQPAAPLER